MVELNKFTEARTKLKSLLDKRMHADHSVEQIEAWLAAEQRGSLVIDKQ